MHSIYKVYKAFNMQHYKVEIQLLTDRLVRCSNSRTTANYNIYGYTKLLHNHEHTKLYVIQVWVYPIMLYRYGYTQLCYTGMGIPNYVIQLSIPNYVIWLWACQIVIQLWSYLILLYSYEHSKAVSILGLLSTDVFLYQYFNTLSK